MVREPGTIPFANRVFLADDSLRERLPRAALAQVETLARAIGNLRALAERRGARPARGVVALFSGAAGTGKTLAAQILARESGRELHVVDLGRVVSKYIGETEKNLEAVLDAAERAGAILFFDEADALFGKRGEVRDSQDRYANLSSSFLLQRLENFAGVALLAVNSREDIDPAFLRRSWAVVTLQAADEP